ncbi:MAG: hypothetical protein COA42_07280 [Alteromonadaceae bacterium]|nr:MAG: hypothetical protein COA42_07280 [Alteromonadaceae bacterium]
MQYEQIIKQLEKRAKSWNVWRKQQSPEDLILDGIELIGLNLENMDFSKLSIRNAVIKECNLRNVDFISSNLEGTILQKNDFTNAKLIAARLNRADLSDSIMTGANMLTASTIGTKFENIDFRGHDLSSLNLKQASLASCNLEGQKLTRINLANTNLKKANLKNTDLSHANFSGSNLTDAVLQGAKLNGTNFKTANLSNVDLSGMDLHTVDLESTNLTNCNLREANLSNANLAHATISGAHLWKIQTHGWCISKTICTHAYWDKASKEKTSYAKHEFERIFAEAITIELKYPYRLTTNELATLPIFTEHLEAVHWGIVLRLKSILDVAGGAVVKFIVEESASFTPSELRHSLQQEAERVQMAQLALRSNTKLQLQLKEKIGMIKEQFWPRLLELAPDHERGQARTLTILFMDLKGFSSWKNEELSEKLSLFRGLVKPVLKKWQASFPNMEGDSLRVTFTNATTGLNCACMMRDVLTAAGFELRIGVELGEVVVIHNEVTEVTDLEGVAVSMAARLEAAAETGEVLVSHKIRHYTDHKDLFIYTPKRVKLRKSIGDMKQGDAIDGYTVATNTVAPKHLASVANLK